MKKPLNHLTHIYAPLAVAIALVLFMSCEMPDNNAAAVETGEEAMAETIASTVDDDSRAIVALVEMNQTEIALSRLALQKSNHEDVKALAQMLVDAHTTALAELTKLAEDRELALPTVLSDQAVETRTELSQKTGKDFDLAYCNKMVEAHEKAIARVEAVSQNAKDADLRGWATRKLPDLRKHLEEAVACQKKCEAA